jgi:integrase
MTTSVQNRYGKWQLRVIHKLLPTPFFHTFDTEIEARDYGAQLHALLQSGVVPMELSEGQKRGSNPHLHKILSAYLDESNVAPTDRATVALLSKEVGDIRLQAVTTSWADAWVSRLKVECNLAPGTVRKRVESLARVIEWYKRKVGEDIANPLRIMPHGYALATQSEKSQIKKSGWEVRRDVQRDRRIDADEIARIRAALSGVVRDDRQRGMNVDPDFSLLFELVLATGMRLSEAFGIRTNQIDFARWVIKVEGSKGHRGAIKHRVVPLLQSLRIPLKEFCNGKTGLIFNFWDGTPADKSKASARLSQRFRTLFDYARVPDCTEHDLRHTATCSWFELRDVAGRWIFSEVEVCRLMGWSDTRMALRYASMRGEDLSSRLG